MFEEVSTIVVLLVFGAIGWWLYRANAAWKRKHLEERSEFERLDHARAFDKAQLQADLQRWSGPH